jgi:hypothetical protein
MPPRPPRAIDVAVAPTRKGIAIDALIDLRLARLSSQMLVSRQAETPEAVVGRILAVQAQDERGFRLAVRSRSSGLTAKDVDSSLNERRLLVTWLNRGTLHLVCSDDYWWLHPLTAPRVVPRVNRRLRQEGVDEVRAEQGVRTIVESLESEGPLSRQGLRLRLDDVGVPTKGQAMIHLLALASLRGLIVRGPVLGADHAYVSVSAWLGTPPAPLASNEALARLALRYLAGHEPASAEDLVKWAGIRLADARTGLAEIAQEVRDIGGVFARRSSELGSLPVAPPRLLGAFDPLLHGWASREPFVGVHGAVVTTNGIFRPVALVGGRVVATWRLPASGVVIDLLESPDDACLSELREDAADVRRFFGLAPAPVKVA